MQPQLLPYSQTREADNVYINVVMPGPEPINLSPPFGESQVFSLPAVSNVTRGQPLLANPSEYYASIIRMTIPLDGVPLLICPVVPNQVLIGPTLNPPIPVPNPNATPFVLGIKFNGNYYPARVLWQPEEVSVNTPPPAQDQPTQVITRYYYMFSYATLVSMINEAIKAAFAAFVLANPGAPQAPFPPPFLIYNAVTQLMSFVWHNSWSTPPPASNPPPLNIPRIGGNAAFDGFINGFRDFIVHDEDLTNPDNVEYIFEDTGDNGYPTNTFPAAPTFLFTTQTFNSIALLASLRKLVVTTNLPIVSEATPIGFGGSISSSSSLPILSDFVVQLSQSEDARSVAYYEPRAQYRLVDLQSNTPLYSVQLSVFWQDKDNGNLYPIFVTQTQQAEIKLAFFKRSLYQKPVAPR